MADCADLPHDSLPVQYALSGEPVHLIHAVIIIDVERPDTRRKHCNDFRQFPPAVHDMVHVHADSDKLRVKTRHDRLQFLHAIADAGPGQIFDID